ncbi:putative polysaccharide biosynthesis protein [Bacillus alveayuensis]|uniref:putative polysaccharide biosynthesis protein n=1 Tax=Aeribacillus alveayuensis TaxID=279215 RepID=UPI0005D1083E|nr:polysaccharide biosynthesis protein [Bacillus alveayuensis]
MSSSKLLRGTFILTFGVMLSRILGLIYVFPFEALVGDRGGALYAYGYVPYTIFISVATMGVPLAVSKFVSKYNALGEYRVGRRLFKSGLLLMSLTGLISFLILYSIAPMIAPLIISDGGKGNTVEDITTVIRAVSFALLLVPVMSLIRGFFQGHESMGPTALSQVIEQLVRIIFLLASCYVVLEVLNGSIVTAISLSTFAAFVGAAGGLALLIWYWFKRKEHLDELLAKDNGQLHPSLKEMYKELIKYAAPFVFVGLAMPLYQLIDLFTFNRAMASIGMADISEKAYAIFNIWVQKLIIIPVTLATSFSLTLIPAITKSYVERNRKLLRKQLNQTFQVMLFLTLPAVVGMALLAEPVYAAFYGYDELGSQVLRWYAPTALLFALFSVTSAVLQGINQQRFTVIGLAMGLFVKLTFNYYLITKFATIGAILATTLGYFISVAFNLWIIKKYAKYRYRLVFRRTILMGIFTVMMSLVVSVVVFLLKAVLHYNGGKLDSILLVGAGAAVGAGIYFYLSYRSELLERLFGSRFPLLNRKKTKKAVS